MCSGGVDAVVVTMKGLLVFIAALHLCACVWHLLGTSENGWVGISGFENHTVLEKYLMSLNWIFIHAQGGDGGMKIRTAVENLFDVLLSLVLYVFTLYYCGVWTHLVITWTNSDVARMVVIAHQFGKRHGLSMQLVERIEGCLSTHRLDGPAEHLSKEKLLRSHLSNRLQTDLMYEIHNPLICNLRLFNNIHHYNARCMREVCYSLKSNLAVGYEHIFSKGDACTRTYFVGEGRFRYSCSVSILAQTPRSSTAPNSDRLMRASSHTCSEDSFAAAPTETSDEHLVGGNVVCEATLWTQWENCGDLISVQDANITSLEVDDFYNVVLRFNKTKIHVVKYAKHFLWHLNRSRPSDVMGFDLSPQDLDKSLHVGGDEDHFAFISHYKFEAGTEAALLKTELEYRIHKDPAHPGGSFQSPVFVDSDDLSDLKKLLEHACGSHALVVLLTPGILTRPWCLVELVAARRAGRKYVPVMLNRIGLTFMFPDDEFFKKLHNDEIVAGGAQGRQVLAENGITLQDVEDAIRLMFTFIALPFSPHKSAVVRAAEIEDILTRCMKMTEESMSKFHEQFAVDKRTTTCGDLGVHLEDGCDDSDCESEAGAAMRAG